MGTQLEWRNILGAKLPRKILFCHTSVVYIKCFKSSSTAVSQSSVSARCHCW